ncbi:MAG TPA: peptidoglycan-binding protein [Lachnospiraceae bacterium]|nr:peptidoglycan-binding protein [Lachnospiraceae bacterium]
MLFRKPLKAAQDNIDEGFLQIQAVSDNNQIPIADATIEIANTGDPNTPLEQITTDADGITERISLNAPPLEFSMEPTDNQPYSEYNLKISAPGYEDTIISGVQILSGEIGLQNIRMTPTVTSEQLYNPTVIGGHTLWEFYPPKIAEAEIKPMDERGEIVLSRVVVPEYIVVHDGAPTDTSALDYYVPFQEYMKNVASCEIYATWSESTITANVLAILSFTLNRVYTEWYRGKGYDFTITSSTAFDHKWIYQKTIYENISQIVDSIFTNYLSRPNVAQPILTQYCDGKRVTCPNWMSQWGSKYLGDQGYTPIEIIRNYYGDDMYINEAEIISGIPASWPGYDLSIGSTGQKVSMIQEQLNRIAQNYPSIPTVLIDGNYGESTKSAVEQFQRIFNLPVTGIVDYPTWYKISQIYVGVSRIAELI